MRGKFAGLGFDPAPGNAGDVRAAADAMAGAGDRLAGSPGSLRSVLSTGDWQGTAAESFAASGAPVPGALETAHGDLRSASQALRTWHGQLLVNQHAAERLDKTAKHLRTEIAEAERDVLAADTRLASATGPARSQAAATLQSAQQHLEALRKRLATTLRAAHRLAQRHQREADAAATALRGNPASTSWPATAVTGVASGVGGTSAWTGQVATITLPGETDPVVALPIGAQPGDPDWPTLPADPTGQAPNGLPDDVTDAAAAPVDPMAPVPSVDGLPTVPVSDGQTRPGSAVLAPPGAPTDLVVTTPAQATATTTTRPGTATNLAAAPTATRPYESASSSVPIHHVAATAPSTQGVDTAADRRSGHSGRAEPVRQAASHQVTSHSDVSSNRPAASHASTGSDRHSGSSHQNTQHSDAGSDREGRSSLVTDRPPASQGGEPHLVRSAVLAATPANVPAPTGGPVGDAAAPAPGGDTSNTTAETATVAPPSAAAESGAAAPATPAPSTAHHDQAPVQQQPHQAQHGSGIAASSQPAPGQQVGTGDQGRPASQAYQGGQQGAEHRKGADHLPAVPLAVEPAPGDYTGVVLPSPPQWDGVSVTPLRTAGLLPDYDGGMWATFVIAAALGPALIAESRSGESKGSEKSAGKQRRKPNRMRAFVLQPGGEQLVMLTLQARSVEGWTTQRALFLRAVAQYRRPAEPVLSS